MKNSLTDLNNHLFAELERLGDESLSDESLQTEIDRAKAITDIAQQVISNGSLVLKAEELKLEYSSAKIAIPKFLDSGGE